MQLYGLDKSKLVLASHAIRNRSYLCPECHGFVRIRGGGRRQIHFYHARRPASCRQHGKSLAHLQIQLHLKSLIPSLILEKKFAFRGSCKTAAPQKTDDLDASFQGQHSDPCCADETMPGCAGEEARRKMAPKGRFNGAHAFCNCLSRIADAYWAEENIVFEVQCSPITLQEAKTRCEDYLKLGLTPVWILHDRRYNRFKLTPAEEYLRHQTPTFYTDGRTVYDQFDVCQNLRRIFRGPKIVVNPALPQKSSIEPLLFRHWPLSFHGDLFHRITPQQLDHLKKIQKRYQKKQRWNLWKKAYKLVLYRLLELVS